MTSEWPNMEVKIHGVVVVISGRVIAEIEGPDEKHILIQVVRNPPRYAVGISRTDNEEPSLFINPFVEDGTEMGPSGTGTRMIQDDVIDFFPELARAAEWIPEE